MRRSLNLRALFLASSALFLASAPRALAQEQGAAAPSISGTPNLAPQLNRTQRPMRLECRNHTSSAQGTAGTDYGVTGRFQCVTVGPTTTQQVALGFYGTTTAGSEISTQGATIARVTLETSGGQIYPFAKNGLLDILTPAANQAPLNLTDPLGVYTPAGSTEWIRIWDRVPQPPALASATPVTGGALSASTTYYYAVTSIDDGLESGKSAQASCTTGASGTLACTLALTPVTWAASGLSPAVTMQAQNVYRGTVSGGPYGFLGTIGGSQSSFTDLGYSTPNAGVTPPAQVSVMLNETPRTGESGNPQYAGGTGTNQTGVTGAVAGSTGPSSGNFIPAPTLVLADDSKVTSYSCTGDSITHGVGIYTFEVGPFQQQWANWCDYGGADGVNATRNFSIGSTQLAAILNGSQLAWGRFLDTLYDDYLIAALGTNDVPNLTWQQIAADHIALAQIVSARGVRYVLPTLIPIVSTADNGLTLSGQTVKANEAVRTNFNTWVRNGFQVDGSGTPVLTGGSPSPYIYTALDNAAAVEVNAAGVPTPNGGLWKVYGTPDFATCTLTGTPTATAFAASGCAFPVISGTGPGLSGESIKMLTGAAAGQTAKVKNSTSATALALYANGDTTLTGLAVTGLTTVPAAGDTFSVTKAETFDGVHPTIWGHQDIGAAFATWRPAHLVPFGPQQ